MRRIVIIPIVCLIFNTALYPQWELRNNNLPLEQSTSWSIGACDSYSAVVSVGWGRSLYKTTDKGKNWRNITLPYDNLETISISYKDSHHIWIGTGKGEIFASNDGGNNWIKQFGDSTLTNFMNYVEMFDLENGIAMGDRVPSTDDRAVILKTSDGGANWISVNSSHIGGKSADTWRRINYVNADTGYFYPLGPNKSTIYKTTDGGYNWVKTQYDNTVQVLKFYDERIGITVTTSYDLTTSNNLRVFGRTLNGGTSWEYFPDFFVYELPADIEFLPGDPSKVWFVSDSSLYFSADTGGTWTEQKIYDGSLKGRDIVFTDKNHGWLLCDDGRVFYTSNNGGIITGIAKDEKVLPKGYSLDQNYPNPFNPSTTITYRVPVQDKGYVPVKLILYDASGKQVKVLVDGEKEAGRYRINFKGDGLASGVYFYSLTSGSYSSTRKMLLLK